MIKVEDQRMVELAEEFLLCKYRYRYQVTFETFVRRKLNGTWEYYI